MARMKHQAIVGNIGHFDNEIDIAGLAQDRRHRADQHQAAGRRVDVLRRPLDHRALRGPPAEPRQRHRPPELRDVELVHEPDDRPDRAVHEERRVRQAGLRAAQAPRREGRPAAPRRARRQAHRADAPSRPPTSASRSRARTSPTTTATSRHRWTAGLADPAGPASSGRTRRCPCSARSASASPSERPLAGVTVGACLHVTSETANLVRTLRAGAPRSRCARPTRSPRRTTSPRRSRTTASRCTRSTARTWTPGRRTSSRWPPASRRSRSTTAPTS